MACELWVVGNVEYQGAVYQNYTRVIVGAWYPKNPLPPISFNRSLNIGGRPFDHYNDGLGGIFDGTGWVGAPYYVVKNCFKATQKYDCVNGACVPNDTYTTPGLYPTLSACQSGCAQDSNCEGECVSKIEISALQQSIGNLQSKICK